MKRLALFAHFGSSPQVAKHVFFHLEHLQQFGFQTGFISNSKISSASEQELKKTCQRIILRDNSGFDFSMWRQGLEEFNLAEFDELLLTNSSIIGPLQPLAPVWEKAALGGGDFWGLTDNDELGEHLQSYFLVFKPQVFRSPRFAEFWSAVLPYQDKEQVIRSYEVGLTRWLAEGGFTWKAVFERENIRRIFLKQQSPAWKIRNRIRRRNHPWQNVMTVHPEILLQCGMPFLKAALLRPSGASFSSQMALALLEKHGLPPAVLDDLRLNFK